MRSTTTTLKDIQAAGGRLDPGYHLAISHLREQTLHGQPLLTYLQATFTAAQAQAWVKSLPAATLAPLLEPLAKGSFAAHSGAVAVVADMAQRMPYETLAIAVGQLPAIEAQAAEKVAQAQAVLTSVQNLASLIRPESASQPVPKRPSRRIP